MNEGTRKAANALVAVVDFFAGALAAEAQEGDERQTQFDGLASQLKRQSADLVKSNVDLACLQRSLDESRVTIDALRARISVLEATELTVQDATHFNDLIAAAESLRAKIASLGSVHREDRSFLAFQDALDACGRSDPNE